LGGKFQSERPRDAPIGSSEHKWIFLLSSASSSSRDVWIFPASRARGSSRGIWIFPASSTGWSPTTQELSSKLNETIEKLQADLAMSTNKIAELERAKSDAERALEETEDAKRDAEKLKQEVEQARVAEKMASDALIAQLRADKIASGPKRSRWEIALYGSVGGVLVILASSAIGFLVNRRTTSASKKPAEKPRSKPIEVSPSTMSPGGAIPQAALERDLELAVAGIKCGANRRYESI